MRAEQLLRVGGFGSCGGDVLQGSRHGAGVHGLECMGVQGGVRVHWRMQLCGDHSGQECVADYTRVAAVGQISGTKSKLLLRRTTSQKFARAGATTSRGSGNETQALSTCGREGIDSVPPAPDISVGHLL